MKRLDLRSGFVVLVVLAILLVLLACESGETQHVAHQEERPLTSASSEPASPDTASADAVEQDTVELPTYAVLDDDVYDVPIKTQVALEILVSGTITEEGLRRLLLALHSEVMQRRGFTYHARPTNVYIYAFTSEEHATSGMGRWIAMLQKNYDATSPHVLCKRTAAIPTGNSRDKDPISGSSLRNHGMRPRNSRNLTVSTLSSD